MAVQDRESHRVSVFVLGLLLAFVGAACGWQSESVAEVEVVAPAAADEQPSIGHEPRVALKDRLIPPAPAPGAATVAEPVAEEPPAEEPAPELAALAAEPAPPPALAVAPATPPPAPVAVEQASAPQPVAPKGDPARVVIPRIGVNNPIVPVGLHADKTLVVPDDANVAGWYTGAPRPGQNGPSIIVGHNSWRGSRGLFWSLHQLQPGDAVEVHNDDGAVIRFVVERVEQHPKESFPSDRVYGNTSRPEVRLITCGGAFDQGQRSYRDNIIVFGVRTD